MDYSPFDLIPEPLLVIDRNHKLIFANKKARELYKQEFQTCYELSHGFSKPCYEYEGHPCPVKLIQDHGLEKSGVVHIHKTKEGDKIFYVLASYYPEKEVYIELHIELANIYKSLRSYAQSPLNLFFEGPIVLFRWKKEEGWPVEFVSPNVTELLGYPAEDFTSGRISYAELIHPEDLPRVVQEVQYHTENRSDSWTHQSYRLKRKDGNYIWVLNHTVPILEEGEIIGYIGYIMDITERHERDELFYLLAETNPYGILIYDFRQNKILYGNRSLEKITGYSLEEILRMENPIELVHPRKRAKLIKGIARRLQGYRDQITYRITLVRKDRRLIHVELSSVIVQYRGKDVSFIVIKDITEDVEREKLYKELATTDPLTGIYNRYALYQSLENILQSAERYKEAFSVLMLDIDNFKKINDTYGHLVGDSVLKAVAEAIKKVIRRSDIFGRLGGEEFLLILPKTRDPYTVGEKIRRVVEALRFEKELSITISVGGTVYKDGDTVDSIIRRADEALYEAKRLGKNRVIIF
ncbi:MAG: diguanylate cyclase domain-containing protein [Aquificaceae bacterium]